MADIRIIKPGDSEWPIGLYSLGDDMPEQLWARGQEIVNRPSLAIVGARAATNYGEHVTQQLVNELGTTPTIVSGGAYGIDAAAHRAALSQGGTTIAYTAGGVDRAYPAGHSQLFERIAQSGTILSEVDNGQSPNRWRFLQRNRLIAAHAQGLVVVEAGFRSGSLNAAQHAMRLRRPVGAVPGPITSVASAGCHRLIAEGATIITSADDITAMIRPKVGQGEEQSA